MTINGIRVDEKQYDGFLYTEYEECPEFVRVIVDDEGRLLWAIKPDGTVYYGAGVPAQVQEQIDVIGSYEENVEFIRVYLDSEQHVLWGIQRDGNVIFGAGVPSQIKNYVDEKISEVSPEGLDEIIVFLDGLQSGEKTLQELLDEKVDGIYVENPEFISVLTDSEDKILEGYKTDGTKYIGGKVENNAAEVSAENNLEYIEVTTDSQGKIINAIDKSLEKVIYGGINITELKRDIDSNVLQVFISDDSDEIYTIENNDSTVTMEIDDDWNVYGVKDSQSNTTDFSMNEQGEIFLEKEIIEN